MIQMNKDKDSRQMNKSSLITPSFDDICNILVLNLSWCLF